MSNPIPSKVREAGHLYEIPELLFIDAGDKDKWIVQDLIRPGDQVLLAGAPKSGKSLLALQLALLAAFGGETRNSSCTHLFARHPKPKYDNAGKEMKPLFPVLNAHKVLYLSFENGTKSASLRLRKQLAGLGYQVPEAGTVPMEAVEGVDGVELLHVFELEPAQKGEDPRRSLQIVVRSDDRRPDGAETFDRTQDFHDLKNLVAKIRPDLVIIDTLIQLHQLNENSNIEMKAVMQAIRAACVRPDLTATGREGVSKETGAPEAVAKKPKDENIAHIIIHHMRKDGPGGAYGPAGAESMRGAGSIHSEAELALLLRAERDQFYFTGSGRDVAVDEMILWRDKALLYSGEIKSDYDTKNIDFKHTLVIELLKANELWANEEGTTLPAMVEWINKYGAKIANDLGAGQQDLPEGPRLDGWLTKLVGAGIIERLPSEKQGGAGHLKKWRIVKGTTPTLDGVKSALGHIRRNYKRRIKRIKR